MRLVSQKGEKYGDGAEGKDTLVVDDDDLPGSVTSWEPFFLVDHEPSCVMRRLVGGSVDERPG